MISACLCVKLKIMLLDQYYSSYKFNVVFYVFYPILLGKSTKTYLSFLKKPVVDQKVLSSYISYVPIVVIRGGFFLSK